MVRPNLKQQQNLEIKRKILRLLDQQNDASLLNDVHDLLVGKLPSDNSPKLSPSTMRYKDVLTSTERDKWALEWLIG